MKLIAVNDAGSQETIDRPQDVTFYLSAEEAEGSFESWFSAYPHLAVDLDGVRYAFSTVGDRLALTRVPGETANPGLYRAFAEHCSGTTSPTSSASSRILQPNLTSFRSITSTLSFMHISCRENRKSREGPICLPHFDGACCCSLSAQEFILGCGRCKARPFRSLPTHTCLKFTVPSDAVIAACGFVCCGRYIVLSKSALAYWAPWSLVSKAYDLGVADGSTRTPIRAPPFR